MFSEKTLAVLRAAYWSPGRKVDLEPFAKAYAAAGYAPPPKALEFLQEFGGLVLYYPHHRNPSSEDRCNFCADLACEWVRSWMHEYEAHVGDMLVPIGQAFSMHMVLVMATDGAVYAFYGDLFCKIGSSGVDAIESLCTGRAHVCSELDEEPLPDVDEVNLQEDVRNRLQAAGWTPGRIVEVPAHCGADVPSSAVRRFLEEFGGLTIEAGGGKLRVDAIQATRQLPGWHLLELQERLRVPSLTPVGILSVGELILLMDDQGCIYSTLPEVPDFVYKHGCGVVASLNAILTSADGQRL